MTDFQIDHRFCIILLIVVLSGCVPSERSQWMSMQRNYRIPIEVRAELHSGYVKPVEVPVNLTRSLSDVNIEGTFDPTSLYLIETDSLGRVIDEQVPLQFDPADGFNAYDHAAGTLLFLLEQRHTGSRPRYFHLYFGEQGKMYDAPAVTPLIRITSNMEFRGQQSIALRNQSASYFYHTMGAGFAGLIDTAGHDWIGYRPGGGSAGEYRGVPNLVYQEGHFHPGAETSTSVIEDSGPIRITISSVTSDSLWRCTWSVYPDFATMTLTKADGNYWFLYEGTPGGVLEENRDYLVLSDGTRRPLSESWAEDLPVPEWLYFADGTADRSLVLIHHADDSALDQYWPMEGNMTVFGFGREFPCCGQYLSKVPAQFSIGLVESREYSEVAEFVQMVRQKPEVKPGRVELRSDVE